jgi:hypothetical protein
MQRSHVEKEKCKQLATCGENCRLCHESLPPKHRRTIFTETVKVFAQLTEVLGYIPSNR